MRILFLSHRVPYPPNKGEKIRAYHELCALGRRHEVDLFTLADCAADMQHGPALEKHCRRVVIERVYPRLSRLRSLPYLFTRTPLTLPNFYSAALARQVRRAMSERKYDRIFVYCSAMAQYVDTTAGIPVVLDLVDVDSDKWRQYAQVAGFPMRLIYRREAGYLRQYEQRVSEASAAALVVTGREARLLREIAPAANVHAIPNGVDADFFQARETPPAGAPTLLFTGDMSYFPNQDAVEYFARQVLPLIQRKIPEAHFLIVGQRPTNVVQKLAELKGVEVTGWVADMRPYLAQAHVAVAPFSIACGLQNKILEAMACGLPVVATPRAVQGLEAEVAAGVDTAADPAGLAEASLSLLLDPTAAWQRGHDNRRRILDAHNWPVLLDRLLELVEAPHGIRIASH